MFSFWKKTADSSPAESFPEPLRPLLDMPCHDAIPLPLGEIAKIRLDRNTVHLTLPFPALWLQDWLPAQCKALGLG